MSDQQELLERETMGIMQDAAERAFRSVSVTRFIEAPPAKPDYPVPYVFVAIDPNGGGDSRFAMVSAYYRAGKMVVVGLEAIKAHKPADYEGVLVDHVNEILHTRHFERARVVLMPASAKRGVSKLSIINPATRSTGSEPGLRGAPHRARGDAKQSRRVVRVHARRRAAWAAHDARGQRGKSHQCSSMCVTSMTHTNSMISSQAMHVKFNDALEDGGVVLMEDLICVGGSAKKLVKDLRDELTTYSCVVDHGASVFSAAKKTFTGKVGGFQDDLAICIQLNMLWHSSFFKEAKYRVYH